MTKLEWSDEKAGEKSEHEPSNRSPPQPPFYSPYAFAPNPASYENQDQKFGFGQYPPVPQYGHAPSFYGQPQGSGPMSAPGPGYNAPQAPTYNNDTKPYAQEGDRGFLGAVGGAAVGGVAGHKAGHGFLGALGGGVAGSFAEDYVKNHRMKKKEEEERMKAQQAAYQHQQQFIQQAQQAQMIQQQQQQQQQQQAQQSSYQPQFAPSPRPGKMGNFHMSSRNVSLDGDSNLVAECGNGDGRKNWSCLDLNSCITNSNGNLQWCRNGNFKATARNIQLVEGGNVLQAELRTVDGQWRVSRLWLNEKIENRWGNLRVLQD